MERVTRAVILSGWGVMLLACFAIVGSVVWSLVRFPDVELSKELVGLASSAFTFLCTTLPKMVSDLLVAYKPLGTQP